MVIVYYAPRPYTSGAESALSSECIFDFSTYAGKPPIERSENYSPGLNSSLCVDRSFIKKELCGRIF